MRIELYKIKKDPAAFNVGTRLEAIKDSAVNNRNRPRNNDYIRLETFEKRGHLWLCDFVKIRMHHGPARAGLSAPARGFNLKDDEGFGEETGFLWDSTNDWCVLQYNHHGVRPTTIAEYLSLFLHAEPVVLEFLPKIDDTIHAKIRANKLVTKFTLSVSPKQLSNADYDLGSGLGDAAKALRQSDADQIEITISAHKRHGGLDLKLPDVVGWIKKLGGASDESPIRTARATARQNSSDAPEVLDLLTHRITSDVDLTPGQDKRYARKHRWDAMHRAHTDWKNLMT